MAQRIVKVAAVQAAPVSMNMHHSLDKLVYLAMEAAENGAQLVVFPEAFLSCYPRFAEFAVGHRTLESRTLFAKYVESSMMIPDNWARDNLATSSSQYVAFYQLLTIARKAKVHISVGVIERSHVGATLWCTNLLISDQGELLSRHRKLQPTAAERIVWSQGHLENQPQSDQTQFPDDNMAVARTALGKIGGLICWENFMPLSRFALYQKGVEIWTAPTADSRPTWAPLMQTIAQEGRCYVVSANQFATAASYPDDYPQLSEESKAEVWSRGGSCIVDPLGTIIAGPLWDEEGILYADIDLGFINAAKLDFDVVGHYARADLFELKTNGPK